MSRDSPREAAPLHEVINEWTWWKSLLLLSIAGGFIVYAVNACCVPIVAVAISFMIVLVVTVFLIVILNRTIGLRGW